MANICWNCGKATGSCAWSKNLKPIPGWNATIVPRDTYGSGKDFTYDIQGCPEFISDKNFKK